MGTKNSEFIREKIKEKPINKKKFWNKLVVSGLCGIVFAIAFCLVLLLAAPLLKERLTVAEKETEETQTNLPMDETETEEENPVVPEEGNVTEDLTIGNYQDLQNQLYLIGNTANKSIVSITKVVNDTDWFNNSYEKESLGSGVIISESTTKYYILTENKYIKGATQLSVSFYNEDRQEAFVEQVDGNTGLAVLSVVKSGLSETTLANAKVATVGNSVSVTRGTLVIALGSPLGTNYSILPGNVTSTNNEISTEDHNFKIFTTNIVGDEDGSGILINVDGEVIGFVMQDYGQGEGSKTLTAVAINNLKPIIDLMVAGDSVPYLGLQVSTVTDKIEEEYDLPRGVYIKEVTMDSPAMFAGLQSGDVITEINGTKVSTAVGYSGQLLGLTPGETYEIKAKRQVGNGYKEMEFDVEVGVLSN